MLNLKRMVQKINTELKAFFKQMHYQDFENLGQFSTLYYQFGPMNLLTFAKWLAQEEANPTARKLAAYIAIWDDKKNELLGSLLQLETIMYHQLKFFNPKTVRALTTFSEITECVLPYFQSEEKTAEMLKNFTDFRNKYAHSTGYREIDHPSVLKALNKQVLAFIGRIVQDPITLALDNFFDPEFAAPSQTTHPLIYQDKDVNWNLYQRYETELNEAQAEFQKTHPGLDFKTHLFNLGVLWRKKEDFLKVLIMFHPSPENFLLQKDILPDHTFNKRLFKIFKKRILSKMRSFYLAEPRASFRDELYNLTKTHGLYFTHSLHLAYILSYDFIKKQVDASEYTRFKNYLLNLHPFLEKDLPQKKKVFAGFSKHAVSDELFQQYRFDLMILMHEYKMTHTAKKFSEFLADLNLDFTQASAFETVLRYKFI